KTRPVRSLNIKQLTCAPRCGAHGSSLFHTVVLLTRTEKSAVTSLLFSASCDQKRTIVPVTLPSPVRRSGKTVICLTFMLKSAFPKASNRYHANIPDGMPTVRTTPMRTRQGYRLPQQMIARIQSLLAETDMTIGEIAERLGYSKAAVSSINRKFEIRNYIG